MTGDTLGKYGGGLSDRPNGGSRSQIRPKALGVPYPNQLKTGGFLTPL